MELAEALALIEKLRAQNAAQARRIERLTGMVERMSRQLDALLGVVAQMKTPPGLSEDGAPRVESKEEAAETPAEDPPAPPPPRTPNRHAHGRGPKPEGLPVIEVLVPHEAKCSCGGHMQGNGTVVTEIWDFIRPHLRLRRIIRKLGRCAECGRRVTPSLPPLPFERASCSFEMLAWVVYAKAALHLPLDRQRREFALQGATISSAMITRWHQEGADLLHIVVQQLRVELLEDSHLRMDGTGMAVLDFSSTGEPAPIGHVTVYSNTRIVILHYSPNKKGIHAEEFLTIGTDENGAPILWKGTITADAESAHDRLFRDGNRIEGGCNAHGIRKFRDDEDKAPLLAEEAMAYIGRFYDVEHEARKIDLGGAALLTHRKQYAGPVAVEFRAWLLLHREDLVPQNPVRKAIQYYLNHWDALTLFLEDPEVPLDNNFSENMLRKLVVGRKNWLFAGGPEGALRICDTLSTVETCKAEGVDPFDYICWVLPKLVAHKENQGLKVRDLTPAAYRRTLPEKKVKRPG